MPDGPGRDETGRELLTGLHRAGVDVDRSTRRRAEYSSDASLYRLVPQAVAFPRDPDDVLAALEVCRGLDVPVTARGAGTSIAGNAVGAGLVLDFSRHLNRVRSVDPQTALAVVEPGAVLDTVQQLASAHGLRFGPDPSTHSRCTIGGMIGNNACGSRSLGYGRTADNVVALDVVTGSGERLVARRTDNDEASPTLRAVTDVVRANLGVIRTEFGRFGRQVSGFSLEHLLPERGFNLAAGLVGTEGTCALLLGATLRLVPAPAATVLVALGYPDMVTAGFAAAALRRHRPTAVEGLDARIVDVVRARRGGSAVPDLPAGRGWLFVELAGDTVGETMAAAGTLVREADALDARIIADGAEAAVLWRIREDGAGLAARPTAGRFSHAGWEDAAVPPERLGDYLRAFEELLAGHGLTGLPYGHFGEGCVHVRIDFPLTERGGVEVFRSFLRDAATLVAEHGGSMSGEHGDGRARSELLPLMYSPAARQLFADVKAAFDPSGLLNPGVIVDPAAVTADLRAPATRPRRVGLAFDYTDDGGDFAAAVHRCTGVGRCRADNTRTGGAMCPSFLATRDERDSTRGRARVLQEMVNGTLVRQGWRSAEVHDALDLCLSCKACSADCPTGVDMATYKAELLHQSYRHRLRPRTHYSLGWLPTWARVAARAPRTANTAMSGRLTGRLGKHLAGVDPRRGLPRFAGTTFRQWFAQHPTPSGDPVLLWVDTFTNHLTPEVGIAAVRVLEAAGYAVRVPDPPLCCGLTWISTGQLDTARRRLRRSVEALAPHVAEGLSVVGLEPSCTAVFRGDAGELLGRHPSVRPVAEATRTLAELLSGRAGWQPPDLTSTTVVAQPHCHHHAVMGWQADREILRRAGATLQAVGGCCGLAGNFGFERGHYDVSVAVAETALLPAVRSMPPDGVLLADGFSCRTQLHDLADRPAQHLAQLLADGPAGSGNPR